MYVQPTIMQYTGKKQKPYHRLQARINLHALTQFYLRTRRHQHSLKRKERATLTDEIGRQGPWTFIIREPWLTEWAHETDAAYPHPHGAMMGRSRRLVPTAASVAAPDLGTLAWRRALSGAAHTDAQVRVTQPAELRLQSASPV